MRDKEQTVKQIIMEAAAKFFNIESNRLSLITVTDCDLSTDKRNATVYISVLPDSRRDDALNFAKRKRGELRTFISKKTGLKHIPYFDVILTTK